MRITAGRSHKKFTVAVAAAGLAASTAGIAGASGDRSARPATAAPASAAVATGPAPAATVPFSVLVRAANAADKGTQQRVGQSTLGTETADLMPEDARVLVDTPNLNVAIMPGRNGQLCFTYLLANGDGGANCNSIRIAETQGLSLYRPGWGIGVVPDSVKSVAVTLEDGTTANVPVTNNVYQAPIDGVQVHVRSAAGSFATPLLPG